MRLSWSRTENERCAALYCPKAPLQQYNAQLVARAAQRQAMRSAADVSVKKARGKKGQDDEDEEDEVRGGFMFARGRRCGATALGLPMGGCCPTLASEDSCGRGGLRKKVLLSKRGAQSGLASVFPDPLKS